MDAKQEYIEQAAPALEEAASLHFEWPAKVHKFADKNQRALMRRIAAALYEGDDEEVGRLIAGRLRAAVERELEAQTESQA